ncbi:hypothetical protein F511_17277 [Dorcoceras hygrometricum]|uniref:Uncharacterized protein n=1 Tax=Dorcoceras hygrometricum TaxID=472368 RepID=A0A2Z7CCS6_9LAMI|nr:hypothetical protein F511_17277 [Dorcoceras hygrometricum]
MLNTLSRVSVRESRIQYLCDPQWFRDTASRGPTTIGAPESQFRTCPTDHAEAEVNVGQHPCSARRKRRRLASAKEPVDAHIRFPDVNAGQLFYSLQLLVPDFGRIPAMFKPVVWLSSFWLRTSRRSRCAVVSFLMHSICILFMLFTAVYSCSPYWGNSGFTAGRGFSPAGGAPGGG